MVRYVLVQISKCVGQQHKTKQSRADSPVIWILCQIAWRLLMNGSLGRWRLVHCLLAGWRLISWSHRCGYRHVICAIFTRSFPHSLWFSQNRLAEITAARCHARSGDPESEALPACQDVTFTWTSWRLHDRYDVIERDRWSQCVYSQWIGMFDTAWGKVCECESETGGGPLWMPRYSLWRFYTYETCSIGSILFDTGEFHKICTCVRVDYLLNVMTRFWIDELHGCSLAML